MIFSGKCTPARRRAMRMCLGLGLGTLLALPVSAQKGPLTYKRDKIGNFNLGFMMGLNYNRYRVEDNFSQQPNGQAIYVRMQPQAGLTLGMVSNLNVADFLSLRVVPHFTFEQRTFEYFIPGQPKTQIRSIETSYFNLPVLAQWRTTYYKKYRIYALSGMQVGFNMISSKRVQNDPMLLKVKTQDVAAVVGVGTILYGDRIKLSPELRYSAGLTNLYVPKNTNNAGVLSGLFSQTLTLCVNFE